MSSRSSIFFAIVGLLFANCLNVAHAQYQKPLQKPGGPNPSPESDNEPEGGYQQPPGRGARQGAQNTVGFGGGEIEIPAISLKLPRIKLPSFSSFHTPPQMLMEAAVAPFVQQFRKEMSFESGGEEPDPDPESDQETPEQKEGFQKPYQQTSVPVVHHDGALAQQIREFEAREHALTQRIDVLQNSVERLITGLESQANRQNSSRQSPHELRPLPEVAPSSYPVRRTNFQQTVSAPPRPLPRTGLQPLPRIGMHPLPQTGVSPLPRFSRLPPVR